jgi:phosphate transport system substrate-binding protein
MIQYVFEMKKIVLLFSCLILLTACRGSSPSSSQKQSLTIKGSDTEVQLVSNIAEEFGKQHKDSSLSVTGGGSGVGIAAVINGEADIANSSRKMKQEEMDQAKKNQREVAEFVLAYDGLSVIVNPANSIDKLTLDQLAKIYTGKILNWKEVGGKDRQIVLYGRQSTSGTFTFFRDTVLKADYAKSLRGLEGNQAILDAVKSDIGGVGYVGAGYVKVDGKPRDDVSIVELQKDDKSTALSPLSKEAVESLQYPLARKIYQYLPVEVLQKSSILKEFLTFENSSDGQKLVEDAGFYALSATDSATNTSLINSGHN